MTIKVINIDTEEKFDCSVFGSPNQKIGNFTQQKLTSFGGVSNA